MSLGWKFPSARGGQIVGLNNGDIETFKDKPIKYYSGLPVTFTAAIIPLAHLITYFLSNKIVPIYYAIIIMMIASLNILNIKIRKPHGIAYLVFALLAIIVLFLFLVVLW